MPRFVVRLPSHDINLDRLGTARTECDGSKRRDRLCRYTGQRRYKPSGQEMQGWFRTSTLILAAQSMRRLPEHHENVLRTTQAEHRPAARFDPLVIKEKLLSP